MYALLFAVIAILFGLLKYRETFVVKYGNPLNNEDLLSFDSDSKLTRAFGTTPDTCPADKPELMDGLCYEACETDYHGVGVRCWADTTNIGIGKVLTPESCADSGYPGYTDTGLLCSKWEDKCTYWHSWGLIGCGPKGSGNYCYEWWTGCAKTGAKRLTCKSYGESHPDQVDGLCYARCPPDAPNRIPGMPYLCTRGKRGLSYDRGAGSVPPLWAFGN